jgi:hypothetical protein
MTTRNFVSAWNTRGTIFISITAISRLIVPVEVIALREPVRQTKDTYSQSHITTDGQSVSQYVLVSSPNLGLLTRVFFSKLLPCLFWGALSDERSGLSCVSLCHCSLQLTVNIYIKYKIYMCCKHLQYNTYLEARIVSTMVKYSVAFELFIL